MKVWIFISKQNNKVNQTENILEKKVCSLFDVRGCILILATKIDIILTEVARVDLHHLHQFIRQTPIS